MSQAITANPQSTIDHDSKAAVLVSQDGSEDSSAQVVNPVEQTLGQDQASLDGRRELAAVHSRRMLSGALWAIGGTLVTAFTYSSASESGGSYFVCWGAILFGVIDFLRGLFGWITSQE